MISVAISITKRLVMLSMVAGFLTASCASASPMAHSRLSAAEALSLVASTQSIADLERVIGKGARLRFTYNDPNNSYAPFRRPKEEWSKLNVLSRPNLLSDLESGLEMVAFDYYYNRPFNPTGGMIAVFAQPDGRIVGWLYSKTLVGHEHEAMPK